MKDYLKLVKSKLSGIKNFRGTIPQTIILCILINFFVELLSRRSFIAALGFIVTNPLIFIYNAAIIFATLSVAFIFKHRIFFLILIAALWAVVGITDFILLCSRTTPFTAVDITLLKSTITIIPHYLNTFHYILAAVLIPVIVYLFIRLYRKAPLANSVSFISRLKAAAFTVLLTLSCVGLTHIGITFGLLAENFGNLANAYHEYGLAYCFVNSVVNTGIDKPKQYSKDIVDTILDSVNNGEALPADAISPSAAAKKDTTPTPDVSEDNANSNSGSNDTTDNKEDGSSPDSGAASSDNGSDSGGHADEIPDSSDDSTNTENAVYETASEKSPNIIMIQLESFFDPMTIIGAEFNKDPVPTFRYLMQEYSSGFINVPSVGAGTANTEFEILTGMNLDFFGPGEYPYKTILQETTCESVSFNLKSLGYAAHAIHNNDGTFYDRNLIFSQLGFDTFTSIEYMQDIELTPKGWCKDFVLTQEIKKALESTPNQDFIYTISVQGHGAYPDEMILENPEITLTLPEEYSEKTLCGLTYYVNQIYEMDLFIGELISYLSQCGEETMLVLYGDHLPGFGFTDEQLTNNSLFQTNYVIWSNFDLEKQDKDMEAYQLYSYIFERLGLNAGIIPKFHLTQVSSPVYLEQLEILEYDMLYGNLDCYGGVNPFSPTDLKMGVDDITVFSYRISQSKDNKHYEVSIIGNNFTEYSNICVNGKPVSSTKFRSSNLITATDVLLSDKDIITVSQIGEDSEVLSTTSELIFDINDVKKPPVK